MEELLAQILAQLKAQSQPSILGFSDPLRTRYIYANRQYPDCLWYFWAGGKSVHEPIEHHAITGIIDNIEVETKEFRGKSGPKLNVSIKADRPYVIQAGMDTMFAKGLIFTLSKLPVEAFRKPIMIAVEAGDTEQVLFARVYNPAKNALVFAPYGDDEIDWPAITQKAIDKVAAAHPSTLKNTENSK